MLSSISDNVIAVQCGRVEVTEDADPEATVAAEVARNATGVVENCRILRM